MKFRSIVALFLTLIMCFSIVACSKVDSSKGNDDDDMDVAAKDKVKIKFLKVGKSPCTIIRTENYVVVIDAASEDKSGDIVTYLAEKEITTIDYLILTNFSKTCIGGVSGILKTAGFTVKNIYEPTYLKESNAYTTYRNAVSAAGITPVKIENGDTLKIDDATFTFYAPEKDYSTVEDENDEGNSIAVGMKHGKVSFLYTSRVSGDRVKELMDQIDGQTFDIITAPDYGRFDDNYPSLFSAVSAKYAVIFASTKNPPEAATEGALKDAGITYYITRDGGVEAKSDGSVLEVKQ